MTAPSLDDAVRLRRERRERGRRNGERSLAQNLAMVGVLGWTIVVPGLLGILLGRWLDGRLGTGIVFTSALVFIGLGVGCALAWRSMRA
jgi:ATP synthase protein I